MIRAFIDTNVFFAACYSIEGASFEIFQQSLLGNVQLVISNFVFEETKRNLAIKSPENLADYDKFVNNVSFEIVNPTKRAVLQAAEYTALKDAPIVAAAKKAKVDYLVSLDRRHLVGVSEVSARSGLQIILPGELLEKLRH